MLRQLKEAKRVEVQRYKGLGEMSAEQLWETTMNPANRTLLAVSIDDAAKADPRVQELLDKGAMIGQVSRMYSFGVRGQIWKLERQRSSPRNW